VGFFVCQFAVKGLEVQTTQFLAVVRHGLSEANANLAMTACGLFYSRSGSDRSVPLTHEGHRQAREVGKRLARKFPRPQKVAAIYHSRFTRVSDTALAIQNKLPYKVKLIGDERLNKRSYGKFWNLTHLGVETLYPDEWKRYQREGDLHYRAPGGENYFDLFARVDAFIDELSATTTGNVVVVTSSATMLSFQRRLEGLTDEELVRRYEAQFLPNAHVLLYGRASSTSPFSPL